jgi:DNA-binding MarR family transcriptional regulator
MFDEDPDLNVGFLLHDVSRLLRKRFDRRARALGLTRAQWRVLAHLAPRQGINQSALADILEVESITLGRHIDRLEDTGWVERQSDPDDRRAWCLFLTDKSRPILEHMEVLAVETQEEAMTGLSEAEREGLRALLLSMKRKMLAGEAVNGNARDDGDRVSEGEAADDEVRHVG